MVGPTAFITAWSVLGATTAGYSTVDDAISRLAASDAPTRAAMSAGFGVFGAGMILYGAAIRTALPGRAWALAMTTGVATLGVAALPLETSAGDTPHQVAAATGYATLAALPVVAAVSLARSGRRGWARYSVGTGVASVLCLVASAVGPGHGLFQRAGLTVVDAWVIATALDVLRRPHGYAGPGGGTT
ncbi:MAG: DUF998 domain-containing protein [Actinomycetota bacterium]|nr:DUF998 domain-containing protein [Actinomycetota bacterium]